MKEFILLLVILNPFAQVLYLSILMEQISFIEFVKVHFKASLMSYIIFILFALIGENYIMKHVFQVRLASLQIFGGIIILYIAFRYITSDTESTILFRGDISELAPRISLPYMIGPGTLWVSMLIGRKYDMYFIFLIIASVIVINFILCIAYHKLIHEMKSPRTSAISKYFAILMRVNALFIGAMAIEMLVTGIERIISDTTHSLL